MASIPDDDFLSEHLGQLLVRQPMSPKSKTSSNHTLPLDYTAKGSRSIQRSASQSQRSSTKMSKIGSRDDEIQSPKNNPLGVSNDLTTPEIISPARDDLFSSFFVPKSSERRSCPSESRNTFTSGMSRSGPGSVSMSTSFGRRQKPNKATLSTGTSSDKDSVTSLSSLSQQQSISRRASEATQPSNESEELLEQIAPETPPDGGVCMSEPVSTSSSLNYGFSQSSPPPNEEEKLQIFNEGGVIEPPEANEINTIARKDVQNANLLPIHRPAPTTERGSSQNSSRYTSITSSRFQSYRSTLSSVPTDMDTHNEDGEFVMDSRRAKNKTVDEENEKNLPKSSIAKHLAARSNSVTLVPSGDDGRTFVFVSRDSDDPSLHHSTLRRDGHTV